MYNWVNLEYYSEMLHGRQKPHEHACLGSREPGSSMGDKAETVRLCHMGKQLDVRGCSEILVN